MGLNTIIKDFEKKTNSKLIYLTEYGSKLYGTNNENSDTDYKGLFIPSLEDILLKKDIEHYTYNTNTKNVKNNSEDVDFQVFSIYKFFNLLKKGETGALDLLFSMFSDSVVFETEESNTIKNIYTIFLNKKIQSFTGYAVGQATKYGIKGSRYKELEEFLDFIYTMSLSEDKLGDIIPSIKKYTEEKETKYISVIKAPGPKTNTNITLTYVEVLGKKYSQDVKQVFFKEKIEKMKESFGNRTKSSKEGTDWKALSHSVRVLLEVEELLNENFITFPLKEKEYVKNIKEGKENLEEVMEYISLKLDKVKKDIDISKLPEKSDESAINNLILRLIKYNKE